MRDGRAIKAVATGAVILAQLVLRKVIYALALEVSVLSIRALILQRLTIMQRGDERFIVGSNAEVLLVTKYDETEGLFVVVYADVKGNDKQVKAITSRFRQSIRFNHCRRSTTIKSVYEFLK